MCYRNYVHKIRFTRIGCAKCVHSLLLYAERSLKSNVSCHTVAKYWQYRTGLEVFCLELYCVSFIILAEFVLCFEINEIIL